MKRAKKDNFIKLIKSAEPQKPATDFTTWVMNEISADLQNEIAINPKLKKLLHQQTIEKAPEFITNNVMYNIQDIAQKAAFTPLISKKAWSIITAAVVIIVIMIVCTNVNSLGSKPHQTDDLYYLDRLFHTIHPIYPVTIMVISILLYLDYFINTQLTISKTGIQK
ncbi:MAG: hypothetical protein ACXVAY_18620 [Mucilaginibacter sp.]